MNDLAHKINQLSRSQIQSIFESYGFAVQIGDWFPIQSPSWTQSVKLVVYDHEPIEDLREDLQVNVEDGTIGHEILDSWVG